MPKKSPLLIEIEAFLERKDVDTTETAFGLAVMNDGKFIPALRGGRRVWPETQDKVRTYIRTELQKRGVRQDTAA